MGLCSLYLSSFPLFIWNDCESKLETLAPGPEALLACISPVCLSSLCSKSQGLLLEASSIWEDTTPWFTETKSLPTQ